MNTALFKKIDEQNKLMLNKPPDSDIVYYSELNEWFTQNAFRSFSVKYVIEECIQYKVDNNFFPVSGNQYMVACKNDGVKAYFENRKPVKSICIDICPQTMAEAFTVLTAKHPDLDNFLDGYFQYPQFYESIHSTQQTSIGAKLEQLYHNILSADTGSLHKEWFLDLAERIIYQEYGNYLALNELNSVRAVTRKEILRRLQVAKNYMEDNFLTITQTKEVARFCSMSEFHFYRSFKQVYKKTPHQFLLEKRLLLAKQLLSNTSQTVKNIAASCSFGDIHSFSKAYKKFFAQPPSCVRKKM